MAITTAQSINRQCLWLTLQHEAKIRFDGIIKRDPATYGVREDGPNKKRGTRGAETRSAVDAAEGHDGLAALREELRSKP